jgi:hypothetical protein
MDEQARTDPFADAVAADGSVTAQTIEVPDRPFGFEAKRAIFAGAWRSFWQEVSEDALGTKHRSKQATAMGADARREAEEAWASPLWWGTYTLVLVSFAYATLRVYLPTTTSSPVAKRNDAFVHPFRAPMKRN